MVEEEAHQIEEEEARPDQSGPGEEATDIEMVNQEELGDPESSGPCMEADTKDNPLEWSQRGDPTHFGLRDSQTQLVDPTSNV